MKEREFQKMYICHFLLYFCTYTLIEASEKWKFMQYFSFWVKIKTLGLKFVPQLTLHCLCHRIKTSKSKEDHFSQSQVNPLFRSLKFFFWKILRFKNCIFSALTVTYRSQWLYSQPNPDWHLILIWFLHHHISSNSLLFHMMTWKATKLQKKSNHIVSS